MDRSRMLSELCDKVSKSFSVNVDAEDIKHAPKFEFLLSDLCNYVHDGGISKAVNAQLQESRNKLLNVKCSYFESTIIRSALEEALRKFTLKSLKQMPTEVEFQLYFTVSNRLSSSDVCNKYMALDKDNKESLFCLPKDFALGCCDPVNSELVQELIIPEVEKSIEENCKTVLEYHDIDANDGSSFSKMSNFPSVIQKDLTKLEVQKEKLFINKKFVMKQLQSYFESMVDSVSIMKKLIDLREKEINYQSAIANFYTAKCKGIGMKARILELQLLNEMYTSDSVPALKVIQNQLLSKESRMEQELVEKTYVLQQYEAVGASFSSLVEEYTQLHTAIENEKWALEELTNSQN